jgi:hypothetical protein
MFYGMENTYHEISVLCFPGSSFFVKEAFICHEHCGLIIFQRSTFLSGLIIFFMIYHEHL